VDRGWFILMLFFGEEKPEMSFHFNSHFQKHSTTTPFPLSFHYFSLKVRKKDEKEEKKEVRKRRERKEKRKEKRKRGEKKRVRRSKREEREEER
jgi:hypothetical protein